MTVLRKTLMEGKTKISSLNVTDVQFVLQNTEQSKDAQVWEGPNIADTSLRGMVP